MNDVRPVTLPTAEPVSLEKAKAHLRVDHEDEDSLIEDLIRTAREQVEAYTGLALTDATYEVRYGSFTDPMMLPAAPITQVVGVTYMDPEGVNQILSPLVYWLDDHPIHPRLFLAPSQSWPSTISRPNAVRVQFKGGYAEGMMPAGLKQAMLLLIGHWYENREQTISVQNYEIPMGAFALMDPHRITWGV
jgi:uncharacterized phiE125 gp8 family phage protein